VRLPGLTWGRVDDRPFYRRGARRDFLRTWKLRWMPDKQWAQVFGQSRVTRWVLVFLGAILWNTARVWRVGARVGWLSGVDCNWRRRRFVFHGRHVATGIVTALMVYRKKY